MWEVIDLVYLEDEGNVVFKVLKKNVIAGLQNKKMRVRIKLYL